jgi:flagellar hook-basal body complex protein FliE
VAIPPVGPVTPAPSTQVQRTSEARPADSFGDLVAKGVDAAQAAQGKADSLAVKAATGDLTDVHDYMIAATQAQLGTELTVAVRNKALEAFNDIMRMPV